MNRISQIFRKHAIRLWPQALVFFALLAAFARVERWYGRDSPNQQTLLIFPTVLVPFACSVLLIALVHQERLVGDRQYWLTRPISRRDLIAAKILFILAFVNLPVFLYQAYMVVTGGLPLLQNWSNFLVATIFHGC